MIHGKKGKKKPRKKMTVGGKTKMSAVPKMTMGSATRFINSEMKKMTPGGATKPSAGAIRMAEGILKKAGKMKYGSMTAPKAKYGMKTRKKKR